MAASRYRSPHHTWAGGNSAVAYANRVVWLVESTAGNCRMAGSLLTVARSCDLAPLPRARPSRAFSSRNLASTNNSSTRISSMPHSEDSNSTREVTAPQLLVASRQCEC